MPIDALGERPADALHLRDIVYRRGLDAPPAGPDDHTAPVDLDPPMSLDLRGVAVGSVVWCTGFAPDFSLVEFPLPFAHGYPVHRRGVVEREPGLYLLRMPILYALTSSFLGGVGRDAAYLADRIGAAARHPAGHPVG